MGPTPAVAAVRCVVRDALAGPTGASAPNTAAGAVPALRRGALVLAACSGGADSVALAAALAFEAPRAGLRAGAVTVDHGLQAGSGPRAAAVANLLRELGLDPVEVITVEVNGSGGPEAAARAARYAALDAVADRLQASAVLLGHTLDDQAETVLLGLARGSGTRSLAGMAAVTGPGGRYRRPLLGVARATTRAACADAELPVWDDPHNNDAAYTRARVRADVLPVLESALGPGVAAALARTADLARADADALDLWAVRALADLRAMRHEADGQDADRLDADGLDADGLAELPAAIRRRVLRLAAIAAGATPGALGAVHLLAIEALVTDWHGQGAVSLPGGRTAFRRYGRLYLRGVGRASG